jgi:ABC-type dipeptide/oligopeptide/nickel transport system permease component
MLVYTIRKLVYVIPTIFVVLVILFFMLRVVPGDPAAAALGTEATAESLAALRESMGLNQPLHSQFCHYVADLLRGDLGKSLITKTPVADEILKALPYTLSYAVCAMIFGIALGIPVGVLTAVKRNSAFDYIGRIFSLAGLSFPEFYLGLLLMLVFSLKLNLLPAVGSGDFAHPMELMKCLILPTLTGGLVMTAYIARMTRSAMLDVLREDYMRTARAKGLKKQVVIFRHGLRNALVSIITIVGMYFGMHFAGSIMIEIIFARQGIGKLLLNAIKQNDYTMVQSVILVYCLIIIAVNLITDLIYGRVDPRIVYK